MKKIKLNRVVVSNPMIGIWYMQVCCVKDATNKEILATANSDNLCGTAKGWVKVERRGSLKPVKCKGYRNRIHVLVSC